MCPVSVIQEQPPTPTRFRHSLDLSGSRFHMKLHLARTKKLKEGRDQNGTGDVVVLAGEEPARPVRKGVRHRHNRVAEPFGALFSTKHQRGNGDRGTPLAQNRPVAENCQVLRRCVNHQLVSFPRAWHQERHRKHERARRAIDLGHEEPHRTGTVAARN